MTDRNRQMGESSAERRTEFDPRQSQQSQDSGANDSGERHGTYEPDDSRNVTGASGSGIGAPGGSDQQTCGERWGGQQGQSQSQGHEGSRQAGESWGDDDASRQQSQFDSATGQQMGEIREHMEVIGADGVHLGTIDKCESDRIKLTKADSGMGSHEGHHHYISRDLVAGVEGDKVRLSANADVAYGMTEEE